jgi:hypothetical protein
VKTTDNMGSLGKVPGLVSTAINKGHKVSLKIKLKSEPPKAKKTRRYYGESRSGGSQGLGLR